MTCFFLDNTNKPLSSEKLAQMSLKYQKKNKYRRAAICLFTCHRIEFYFIDSKAPNSKDLKSFDRVEGENKIYRRLLEISAGIKSEIIGENPIFKQVAQGINNYLYYHPEKNYLLDILSLSKKIRDKNNFYADNHGQLIVDKIKNSGSKKLILVGAGYLNQEIISHITVPTTYNQIYLVTRDVGRANKIKFPPLLPIKILSMEDVKTLKDLENFDIFISTNFLSKDNKKNIISLFSKKGCNYICDLSSCPIKKINSDNKKYYSLYSKNTGLLIKKSNLSMEPKKKIVAWEINKIYD